MRALGLNVELLNSELSGNEPSEAQEPQPQLPPQAAE
jgi:hypothetical protein